jgi:hypothetical protein
MTPPRQMRLLVRAKRQKRRRRPSKKNPGESELLACKSPKVRSHFLVPWRKRCEANRFVRSGPRVRSHLRRMTFLLLRTASLRLPAICRRPVEGGPRQGLDT